jgi:hypothetical protein
VTGLTVVDTDILIDAGRSINEAVDYLQELERNTPLAVSVVTQMELIVGCRNKAELGLWNNFSSVSGFSRSTRPSLTKQSNYYNGTG